MCTLESYIKLELSGIRGVALGVMQSEPSVTAAVSDLYSWMAGSSYFFFFQAEDDIRDHCVTGVQTCALPIFNHATQRVPSGFRGSTWFRAGQPPVPAGDPRNPLGTRWVAWLTADGEKTHLGFHGTRDPDSIGQRSEERRVGKECRSRWSPDH